MKLEAKKKNGFASSGRTIRKFKKTATTTATATATSLRKRFHEQNNGCARAFLFLPSSANNNVKSPNYALSQWRTRMKANLLNLFSEFNRHCVSYSVAR